MTLITNECDERPIALAKVLNNKEIPGGVLMVIRNEPSERSFSDLISVDELLSGLDPRHRKALTQIERHVHLTPGTLVFASHDSPEHIYIHRRGNVAIIREDHVEKLASACPVGSAGIYGLTEALSSKPFAVTMKTVSDAEFDVIDRDDLIEYLRHQPELCFRLAELFSRLYQKALETIKSH